MTKTALLIGVSDYGFGFNPLPRAQRDVRAMRQVLQHPKIGNFTEVRTLVNPDRQVLEEAIEALFSGRQKDDLVLLYFSGHAIKDSDGKLYLTTNITRKSERGEQLVKSSVVPASFVREAMNDSRSQQQVMILDYCLSEALTVDVSTVDTEKGIRVGISATDVSMSQASVEKTALSEEIAFPHDTGWLAKDDSSLDTSNQLGGKGRVILTSSTSTPSSFEHQASGLSVYTHYLVEGIETGVSDLDNNGAISIEELHEYASRKARTATPVMQPRIYRVENHQIILAEVDLDDPRRRYRKEVERYAGRGEISVMNRSILGVLRDSLRLQPEEAAAIEAAVLEPYREYQRKLQRYVRGFIEAIHHESSIGRDTRNGLKSFQQILGLTDVDVAPIEAQVTRQRESFPPPDQVVESTKLETTTVANGMVKPGESRHDAVAANPATPALTGATTIWDRGAYPASIAPRTIWLLIGIGVTAILAWAGVVYRFSSRPTAPPGSLLKPRPTSVPESLPSSMPPLPAPAAESPLPSSLPTPSSTPSPQPTMLADPSPSPNSAPPVSVPTSSVPTSVQSQPKVPVAQPKPRSAATVTKPSPSKPSVPAEPTAASKPIAVPDPPMVSPEPPPTSAPKAPSSLPEPPPTSWSEPPPTSAPGQGF